MAEPKIYTRTGDDGTTGLLYGGRVAKDSPTTTAYGEIDEAQAFIGVARAQAERGGELDQILLGIGRELYVVMSELATLPENHHKLEAGVTRPTDEMVRGLESLIDRLLGEIEMPTDFVVPGNDPVAAALDVARTVVRRAERACIGVVVDGSHAGAYLNRLSDALWALARWAEGRSEIAKTS